MTYLSDPAQSGIKFVQAISAMRKVRNSGRDPNIIRNDGLVQCLYSRANEDDVNSGWRIDNLLNSTGDPYENSSDAVRYFSQGNTLTIVTRDSPAQGWDDLDAVKVDDRFQMYVIYFAGGNHPGAPTFQRRIGSLTWNWGGQVVYDSVNPVSSNTPYRKLLPLYAQPGPRNRDAVELSAQVRSSELSDIGDEVERSVKEKMPKWKRNPATPLANNEASVPISERESVLIDQWISDDAVVKVTILKHSSAGEAAAELQKFISGVNSMGRLHNMGDEAYSWGIRGSIAFRRGKLTIYISAVAENVIDEATLSRDFARHVAATLSKF